MLWARSALGFGVAVLPLAVGCTCKSSSDTAPPSALPGPTTRSIPITMASARNPFGPTVAGSFYPASAATLDKMVHSFLADTSQAQALPKNRRVVALISPHAGYVYSGPVAGTAFNALAGETIRTAIVLGPNHRAHADTACTIEADAYRTPIGDVPIATEIVQQLVRDSAGLIVYRPRVLEPEHSVDVQIPFIHVALPEARVVPIVVPYMPRDQFKKIADLLFAIVSKDSNAVLILSSDLSHFFPYETARKLDDQILQEIEKNDVQALLSQHDVRSGPCGVAPIVVGLDLLHRFNDPTVLKLRYQNSGDTAGDRGRVVGYGAMAFTIPRTL